MTADELDVDLDGRAMQRFGRGFLAGLVLGVAIGILIGACA